MSDNIIHKIFEIANYDQKIHIAGGSLMQI